MQIWLWFISTYELSQPQPQTAHQTGNHFLDLAISNLIGLLYATSCSKGTQGFFLSTRKQIMLVR